MNDTIKKLSLLVSLIYFFCMFMFPAFVKSLIPHIIVIAVLPFFLFFYYRNKENRTKANFMAVLSFIGIGAFFIWYRMTS